VLKSAKGNLELELEQQGVRVRNCLFCANHTLKDLTVDHSRKVWLLLSQSATNGDVGL
jgi:hypothetical protein